MIKEKEMIFRGFNSAGTSEAMQNGKNIYEKTENLFRELFVALVKLLASFSKYLF